MKSLYAQYAISILYFKNPKPKKKISETSRKPETMIIMYTLISTTCYTTSEVYKHVNEPTFTRSLEIR